MKNTNKTISIRRLLMTAGSLSPFMLCAQDEAAQATTTYFSNPLFNTLLTVIIILAIMVLALSGALKNLAGSDLYLEKLKKDREQRGNGTSKTLSLIVLFSLISFAAFSQDKAAVVSVVPDDRIGGLDQFTFYFMMVIISAELLVLGVLFNTFKKILGVNKPVKVAHEGKVKTKTIFDTLNDTVELEQEESILLDHDYDGIKELDNNLPPWWKYGFYLTILVAVIYLINYHVTGTAPLQKQEYANSIKKAEAEIAEYMKNSANNVDETTVKMLTDASELSSGKELFVGACAACHGKLGEGGVGPNLTDEYWLHGGSVRDIFKTIKYGWPDKGMKSWKEDYSPVQIAQLASFIRTLKGSNPPKPKDKQGELYIEQSMPGDSTVIKGDTTNTHVSERTK